MNFTSFLFMTEEDGGSRAALGTTVELELQAAPRKLSPKAHSFNEEKKNVDLAFNFPPTFAFRTPQQKRCDHRSTLSPSATASGLGGSRLKDESKKEKKKNQHNKP